MQLIALILLFAGVPSSAAMAQRPPVRMQLETMSIRGRSGGPIPVLIKLEHEGNQILQGDLVLTIYQSQQTPDDILGNLRYEGIVLQGTDYFVKTILPPFAHSWTGQYLITGWFETDDGKRISLSKDPKDPNAAFELLTPSPFVRTTLVCSCSGQVDYLKPSGNLNYLNKILSLENYIPSATAQNQQTLPDTQLTAISKSQIRYFAAPWDALNLPDNPLHLTCFDIVVLGDRSLGRLDENQLDALKVWIDAGGSLCVVPDEQPLKSTHIGFLKTLFETADDSSFRISRTDTGKIEVLSETPDKAMHRRYGLGAVSLMPVTQNLEQALTSQDKGKLVGHLWNIRHDSPIHDGRPWMSDLAIERLKRSGFEIEGRDGNWIVKRVDRFGRDIQESFQDLSEVSGLVQNQVDFTPMQNILTTTANTALMPKGVQMVPPWVIATLLLAYVATIGPIDYWLLGLLKARKFTWVLFPVVTAVFTGLTIMIAHAYMSSTETGGQISIVDLVDEGRAVRETVLQMNFFGASTTVETDHKQSIHVPAAMDGPQFAGFGNQPLPSAGNKPLDLSGRFPQNYRSEVNLSQWDPFLTRTFRLQPEIDNIPPIEWGDPTLVRTADGHKKLTALLNEWEVQDEDLRVDAVVMFRSSVFRLKTNRPAYVFDSSIAGRHERLQQNFRFRSGWRQQGIGIGIGVVESSAASDSNSYFSLVSQVAPQGDASLEDLPIADLTDPHQWLLMIAVVRDNQIQVFRKVFHLPTLDSEQPQ